MKFKGYVWIIYFQKNNFYDKTTCLAINPEVDQTVKYRGTCTSDLSNALLHSTYHLHVVKGKSSTSPSSENS